MQFLIADDSEEKILMLSGFLKRMNFQGKLFIARTTEEAKIIIDKFAQIDFAFVDYYIPSTNGPSVIRHLHDTNPRARIALVSSADSPKNAREAREAGAEGVVCTSKESDVVEKQITEILQNWGL